MSHFDLDQHVALLQDSFQRLLGRPLANGEDLNQTAWIVVSHGLEDDPIFNYGNPAALALFELDWAAFTRLPSRKSAEPVHRDERAALLERVTRDNLIDDYAGIRISSSGKRFQVNGAIVWNLIDADGVRRGQAATFRDPLPL